jgi:hypothetical protein
LHPYVVGCGHRVRNPTCKEMLRSFIALAIKDLAANSATGAVFHPIAKNEIQGPHRF